ncbi:MAG: hypothetical protein R3C27_12815 [Hyphomonadaceae bacterium]
MSVAQALAIAAAAWVVGATIDPPIRATVYTARAKLEFAVGARLEQIGNGFCATPDGVRMERDTALR